MKAQKIPDGFLKCEQCGEYRGKTRANNLNWEVSPDVGGKSRSEELISVTCLCDGIVCSQCKINKIHKPGSNTYDRVENRIEHWFYLSGMFPCAECRKKNDVHRIQWQEDNNRRKPSVGGGEGNQSMHDGHSVADIIAMY